MTDTATPARPGRPDGTGARRDVPRRSRGAAYLVLAVAVAVAVAAGLAVTVHGSGRAVTWQMRDYRLVDAGRVQVRFEVTKAPLAEAVCTLRARDDAARVVGTAQVTVGPRRDARRTTEVSETLPTSGPAERAEMVGCRIIRTR